MKITIMALHLGFGGIEKYIAAVAGILSRQHEVEIIATYQVSENPAFFIPQNVKISYLLPHTKPNREEFKQAYQERHWLRLMKEIIVSFLVLSKKKIRNKRAIRSCQSDILISTRDFHNRLIQKYADSSIVKVATEHNHHQNQQDYIDRLVASCNRFDYFLPISKELTGFYQPLLPDVDVRYIPFFVEKASKPHTKRNNDPVYVSVGRLSKEKGSIDLIKVFQKIHSILPNAVLHIAGDGPCYQEMISLTKTYQLQENIIFHGFLKREQLAELYHRADIFLMTSQTESFGFVLLEAMSFGLPCIAFDSAQGAHEIIVEAVNGYFIADRDEAVYAKTAVDAFVEESQYKNMQDGALRTADGYAYENTMQEWLTFIDEIAEKKEGHR